MKKLFHFKNKKDVELEALKEEMHSKKREIEAQGFQQKYKKEQQINYVNFLLIELINELKKTGYLRQDFEVLSETEQVKEAEKFIDDFLAL